MSTLQERIERLEDGLAKLRDQLAIYQLITSYGPLVDSGDSGAVAQLWTQDGTYDAQLGKWTGHDAIAGMVNGTVHQDIIQGGAAHVIGMPHVRVDGDRAIATCYARLYRWDPNGEGFKVRRITANRWDLLRTSEGWRVRYRVNRQLDGSEEARQLLNDGMGGPFRSDAAEAGPSRKSSPKSKG
jgi:hypothetical protein